MPLPQDVLRRDLDGFNAEHSMELGRLQAHLESPGGRELLASIDDFRTLLDQPPGDLEGGVEAGWSGAKAFVALLTEHPSFATDGRGVGIGLPVFGDVGSGVDGFRSDAVDLITAGAIAIVAAGADPKDLDRLVDIAGASASSAWTWTTRPDSPYAPTRPRCSPAASG
jgi:hypothetical protein